MSYAEWRPVWERLRAGRHVAVTGPEQVPPPPTDLHLLRVNCAAPWTTTGPLEEALRQIERLLGSDAPALPRASTRASFPPLADAPGQTFLGSLVAACNRLADWDEGRAALCLEAVDLADPDTLTTLTNLLTKPGWLRLPLLLTVREADADPARELLTALRAAAGTEALLEIAPQPDTAKRFDWRHLPAEVYWVLRAGALIGAEFDAALVARLLDEDTAVILNRLQTAADAGAPLTDLDDGRFSLGPATAELRAGLLPSVADFWHRRLGALLAERDAAPPPADAAAQPEPPAPVARPSVAELLQPEPKVQPPPPRQPSVGPALTSPAEAPPADLHDQVRAAGHLHAAGETEEAAVQYLSAARQLIERGNTRRAMLATQQALRLLDGLPNSPRRAQLRVELLLQTAVAQSRGYGYGETFSLAQALETLRAAKAALPDAAPAELIGRLAAATAGVCYDLGDEASLHQALADLDHAGRRLAAAGRPVAAAALLSDRATILLRLGDMLQAGRLLAEAQAMLEQRLAQGTTDESALAVLAQVHHALARLTLHAGAGEDGRRQLYQAGLEHAASAEQGYQQLHRQYELARVEETAARLETRLGRYRAAQERLSRALTVQHRLRDITGMARSCAALADLQLTNGQPDQALALLADSVALNAEQGSPVGLAFNRHSLNALAAALQRSEQQDQDPALSEGLARLERELAQAEDLFGRLPLSAT